MGNTAQAHRQPIAEVFGFCVGDSSPEAVRHLRDRLCPFNNRVPSCTKDKARDPLGVCSIFHGSTVAITCPVRFRQNWLIASDAARFFFPPGATWTSLTETRLNDRYGKSAGKIDIVLVSYDSDGQIVDFGALEIQAVYVSGNIRRPFTAYIKQPSTYYSINWSNQRDYPRPDYLSSSRKRLAPQLIYKGGILHSWGKKIAVAIDGSFFAELPPLPQVQASQADVAWLVYELRYDEAAHRYNLVHSRTVYTRFTPAIKRITVAEPGSEADFVRLLQRKLDAKRTGSPLPAEACELDDAFGQEAEE